MRYAVHHKQHTRDRIVEAASRGFREHGVAGLGVAARDGRVRADARRLLRALPRQGGARRRRLRARARGLWAGIEPPAGLARPRRSCVRLRATICRRHTAAAAATAVRLPRSAPSWRAARRPCDEPWRADVKARLRSSPRACRGARPRAGTTPRRCSSSRWSARWWCHGCCPSATAHRSLAGDARRDACNWRREARRVQRPTRSGLVHDTAVWQISRRRHRPGRRQPRRHRRRGDLGGVVRRNARASIASRSSTPRATPAASPPR